MLTHCETVAAGDYRTYQVGSTQQIVFVEGTPIGLLDYVVKPCFDGCGAYDFWVNASPFDRQHPAGFSRGFSTDEQATVYLLTQWYSRPDQP